MVYIFYHAAPKLWLNMQLNHFIEFRQSMIILVAESSKLFVSALKDLSMWSEMEPFSEVLQPWDSCPFLWTYSIGLKYEYQIWNNLYSIRF